MIHRIILVCLLMSLSGIGATDTLLQEGSSLRVDCVVSEIGTSDHQAEELMLAHGGGLNACGCHFNRKTGTCHCHKNRGCGCECEPATCGSGKVANTPAEQELDPPDSKSVTLSSR